MSGLLGLWVLVLLVMPPLLFPHSPTTTPPLAQYHIPPKRHLPHKTTDAHR